MDHDDTIFLIKSTNKDREFPLITTNLGTKLDNINISGKSKNDLLDLIYDTQKNVIIQRKISINDKEYMVKAYLLSAILNNVAILNKDLFLYPPDKTIITFFTELNNYKYSFEEVVKEYNLNFLDILKFIGLKNLLYFFLVLEIFNLAISSQVIEPMLKNYGGTIIEFITGD